MNIFEFIVTVLQAGAIMLGIVIAIGLCLGTVGYYFARARTRSTGVFNSQAIISIMRQLFITLPLFVFTIAFVGSVLVSVFANTRISGPRTCTVIWTILCIIPCVTVPITWGYSVVAFFRVTTMPQSWESIAAQMREQRGSFLKWQQPLYPIADEDRVFLASLRGTFRGTKANRFGMHLISGLMGVAPLLCGLSLISAGGWPRWPDGQEWILLSVIVFSLGGVYYFYKESGDSYSFDGSVIVQRRRDGSVRQELNIRDITSWYCEWQGSRPAFMHLATKHATMCVVVHSDMRSEFNRILQQQPPEAAKQPSDVEGRNP